MAAKQSSQKIPAIRVRQWLPEWNKIRFDPSAMQARPPEEFFTFSMKASDLKALTGVYRRSVKAGTPRALDPNVQRGHEEARSDTIQAYVKNGFPWCDMSEAQRSRPEADLLRKPGWLPTAILVNVLQEGDKRNGVKLAPSDSVAIEHEAGNSYSVTLPRGFGGPKWAPSSVFPFEVIDGQHRLWAFEDFDAGDDYELPVVAFVGLDRSWQAYLFWSVNITPKRINRSLAFDLYPLLRQEDWLDKFSGHAIYREARCQELTETLWSHDASPWHKRINMLGESSKARESVAPMVSQAAWIRSLMVTFVKQWEGSGTKIGGLFGAPMSEHETVLPWNRPMQAAFLIAAGNKLRQSIKVSKAEWAISVRSSTKRDLFGEGDAAFEGPYSLLSTDQGIRGYLNVVNDLFFIDSAALKLDEWRAEDIFGRSKKRGAPATEERYVNDALASLSESRFDSYLDQIAKGLASYDWRTSGTPGLSEEERLQQAVFRGSSGYRELRKQLLVHLVGRGGVVAAGAKRVLKSLGMK